MGRVWAGGVPHGVGGVGGWGEWDAVGAGRLLDDRSRSRTGTPPLQKKRGAFTTHTHTRHTPTHTLNPQPPPSPTTPPHNRTHHTPQPLESLTPLLVQPGFQGKQAWQLEAIAKVRALPFPQSVFPLSVRV